MHKPLFQATMQPRRYEKETLLSILYALMRSAKGAKTSQLIMTNLLCLVFRKRAE